MRMRPDCLVCLFDQALRTAKLLSCDEECALSILHTAANDIEGFGLDRTPPEAAAVLYPHISQIVGLDDPFAELKLRSTNRAFEYLDFVWERIDEAPCKIDAALRAAVAGNVIDFATNVRFDLSDEIRKVFEADFAIDEKPLFIEKLKKAKSFLLIGDNAGEHVYDKVLLEVIAEYYPDMERYYMVRGRPIINDVTAAEARAIGIDTVATIVDSGVDTPGFLPERANEEARRLFESVDLILAKGMGNFECLDTLADPRLFHLFKVKCEVVSQRAGAEVGALVCVNNAHIDKEDR